MSAELFDQSAAVTADTLINRELTLGEAVLVSTQKTLARVGCNTNMGILLLCVPIAHAAFACDTIGGLQGSLERIIGGAGIEDTQAVFDAIALMSPGGLGDSQQHDVRSTAETDLLTVMQYGAERDRIAWQYANNFDDILSLGCKSFLQVVHEPDSLDAQILEDAAVSIFFEYLCSFPDSHIVRKHGAYMGEVVRDEALKKRDSFNSLSSQEARRKFLLGYDQELKFQGINPGTSADLTVATLFVSLLSIQQNHNRTHVPRN